MTPSFLQALAQPRPDPGGGAAAAHGAALALALMEKVARLEQARPAAASPPGRAWGKIVERVRRMSAALSRLREEDVQAYFQLTRARAAGNPRELREAVQEAVACPQRIAAVAGESLGLLLEIGEQCRRHLVSDLLVAGEFLGAAWRGAQHIAGANLPLLADPGARQTLARELVDAGEAAAALEQQVRQRLLLRTHACHPGGR